MKRRVRIDGAVGYGQPPKETRFQPGQSGNPRGRPKGSKNLKTIVEVVLNEKVEVTESGRRRKVTKLELVIRQLVNKAAGGEIKNTALLLKVLVIGMSANDDKPTEQIFGGIEDEQLLAELLQAHGAKLPSSEADDDAP